MLESEFTVDCPHPGSPADRGPELRATLAFQTSGRYDPTARMGVDPDGRPQFVKAWRSAAGPVTLRLTELERGRFRAEAWGPGAEQAIAAAPELLGASDCPSSLVAQHPPVERAIRFHRGLRLSRAPWLVDRLMGIVLEQRVKVEEAWRSWRYLVQDFGEPAPAIEGLMVAPECKAIRRIGFDTWWRWGVDRKRAGTLCEVAFVAAKVEGLGGPDAARALFAHIKGVGPWTEGMFCGFALGDPDAVVVGDLHMPHQLSKALTGIPFGDDDKMLELLAPYAGQRFRVQVLLARAPAARP